MPYEYRIDRLRAEAVLRELCVGAEVGGVWFGVIPQLLLAEPESVSARVRGQVYLNLGSTWRIFSERPEVFPVGEDGGEEPDEDEALRQLCALRATPIASVELLHDAPDLVITFTDGRVFFLNGRHDYWETWQFGVAYDPAIGTLVVAVPGNEVAVWDRWSNGVSPPAA